MWMVNSWFTQTIWVQEAPTDAFGVAPLAVLDSLGHVVAAVPGQRVMQIPACYAVYYLHKKFGNYYKKM